MTSRTADTRPPLRCGIDLGGTKIEGIVLDAHGAVLAQQRVPTPRAYASTLDAIATLVTALETRAGAAASVGLGIPGVVVPATGLVKNANSTWLNGQPLSRDLEARLGRPVRVQNDANCFALSEATDGAAAGAGVVFGVIMGTGVGGGIIVRGEVLVGRNLIGGEWGHNPLPWPAEDELPGPPCYCGRAGCIETWISGPGIAADHARRTGERLEAPAIIAAAAAGDTGAMATQDRLVARAARALASVINVLDPDVIVLGGGVSNIPDLPARLMAALPPWVFTDRVDTPVVRHRHGDASGVRGAAWLWPA